LQRACESGGAEEGPPVAAAVPAPWRENAQDGTNESLSKGQKRQKEHGTDSGLFFFKKGNKKNRFPRFFFG